MQVVALIGLKGAGKDTAAQVFELAGWVNLKFATPLKRMLQALVMAQGASYDEALRITDGDLKEEPSVYLGGRTGRKAMQTLGTEWGREQMGSTFWIDRFVQSARGVPPGTPGLVITDARFPNEFDLVRAVKGEIFRIDRPELTRAAKEARAAGMLHESECHVLDAVVDGELRNNFPDTLAWRASVHTTFADRL